MFQKTCSDCKQTYTYETPEEHEKYFYKKGQYYMNRCRKCESKRTSSKYKSGEYKRTPKKVEGISE